eukprot:COSAG04_NODE_550_length_12709_cov_6.177637_1_plen_86_part_00
MVQAARVVETLVRSVAMQRTTANDAESEGGRVDYVLRAHLTRAGGKELEPLTELRAALEAGLGAGLDWPDSDCLLQEAEGCFGCR